MEPRRDFLLEAMNIALGRSDSKPEKNHLLALLNLYDPVGIALHFGCRDGEQYLDFCEKHGLTPSGLASRGEK